MSYICVSNPDNIDVNVIFSIVAFISKELAVISKMGVAFILEFGIEPRPEPEVNDEIRVAFILLAKSN